MKQTLLFIFCGFALSMNAQINFFKMYGGDEFDYGYDFVQTADSGFLITGGSGSFRGGHSDAFLLKVAKSGFYEWSIPYGGLENEVSRKMLHMPNHGVYLIGSSNSWSGGDYDTYIAFTDESGNLIWEKTFAGVNWEEGVEAAFVADTGMIVGVNRYGTETLGQDIALMRLDQSGDTVWTQEFSFEGEDEITNIERYRDSLYLVSSNRFDTTTDSDMAHLLLLHRDGTILWEDTLGSETGDYTINDFFISNDTLFGIGGRRAEDTMTSDFHTHRYVVDPVNHYEILNFGIHSAAEWEGDVITNYYNSDHRYAAYRAEGDFTTVGTDVYIGRHFYTLGWLTSVGLIEHEGDNQMHAAIPTSDGGAAMIGSTTAGSGGSSIALVKIGEGEAYPTIEGVTYVDQLVGLDAASQVFGVQLYPNPATSEIQLSSESILTSYTVMSMAGKVVQNGPLDANQPQISIAAIPSGVYLLELKDVSNTSATIRFVIR